MQRIALAAVVLSIATSAAAEPANESRSPVPLSSKQLVAVRSASWNAPVGALQRFERTGSAVWAAVGPGIPVDLGRHGMAWGRGLQEEQKGPAKREGDGRSPAGVFALGPAFGYADALPEAVARFPYRRVQRETYCVEDVHSGNYNRWVEGPFPRTVAWERRSEMYREDGLFRSGLVVKQNDVDTRRGAGSCIFLHIWRGLGQGTAGCTATAADRVEELLRWLRADAEPLLV